MSREKILQVTDLSVSLQKRKGQYTEIIKSISFDLYKGECLGILGESGSGKSMSAKAILGLLNQNFKVEGTALYQGENLLIESEEKLRRYRGSKITMILQNPMTCFDPLYTLEEQIKETWVSHNDMEKAGMHEKAINMFEKMKLHSPEEILGKYPHQLSGGMLQRIMIGLALSMEPDILIADEPTTAIDAITQYEIMKEFKAIKQKNTAMIFITHDLSVISQIADRVLVMNQGKIVDQGNVEHIVKHAEDAYTKQLVYSKMMVMKQYHQILGKEA
jgi:nickel transport system ATP-binding protein